MKGLHLQLTEKRWKLLRNYNAVLYEEFGDVHIVIGFDDTPAARNFIDDLKRCEE